MSTSTLLKHFRKIRSGSHRFVENLDNDILLKVSDGAPNNILWNFGHIIVDGCEMLYRSNDLKSPISAKLMPTFRAGSSPSDWAAAPDVNHVLDASHTFTDSLESDYAAGLFDGFDADAVESAWPLDSIEEVIVYHTIHESVHIGYMMALRGVLSV